MERLGPGGAGMEVGQAAGLFGGGERDHVAVGLVGCERRQGVCSARGEKLSTGLRPPFRRGGPGGAGGDGEERAGLHRQGRAERFCTTVDCVDISFLSDRTLDELPVPSRVGNTQVGSVDLNKPRIGAALSAALALAAAPPAVSGTRSRL